MDGDEHRRDIRAIKGCVVFAPDKVTRRMFRRRFVRTPHDEAEFEAAMAEIESARDRLIRIIFSPDKLPPCPSTPSSNTSNP